MREDDVRDVGRGRRYCGVATHVGVRSGPTVTAMNKDTDEVFLTPEQWRAGRWMFEVDPETEPVADRSTGEQLLEVEQ